MADGSVDSIVTDPPYELGFMGKSWDSTGIAYSVEMWTEALRVLKPGGHLLAFSGSRTYHRMAVAIEDAGFQIRDQIMWLYGSGFPKSLNLSKAIESTILNSSSHSTALRKTEQDGDGDNYQLTGKNNGILGETRVYDRKVFSPSTTEAQEWEGWGTALKPAHEPIVMARKPFAGTVANNVLQHGTGALNIDGSRVGIDGGTFKASKPEGTSNGIYGGRINGRVDVGQLNAGRWPANVIHDGSDEVVDGFPTLHGSGNKSDVGEGQDKNYKASSYEISYAGRANRDYGSKGGSAARFFYCAKANKRDRNEGLDGFAGKEIGGKGNGLARTCATCGASVLDGCQCPDRTFTNPTRANHHPTVKPVDLMRYLVKLITPPKGVVLDPFMGSGSTGKGAVIEGFNFVGIEQDADYLDIARARIQWAGKQEVQLGIDD
jgi:site-specific DNA-methyltransferase (adenine-specific)